MDYKVGDKIKIIEMVDEPAYTGKTGTIEHIDGMGQLHGTWGSLAVIPEEDSIEIIGGQNQHDFQPEDEVERELFEAMGPRKYTDDAYLGMTPEQRKRERARRRREAAKGTKAEVAKPVEEPVETPVEKSVAKEPPEVSKPVEEKTVYSELKKLETDDYQKRGGSYPRSGVADSIRVNGDTLEFEFKNTSTRSASSWAYDFLTRKGFYVDRDYVESYQSGDYGDDWVTTYVALKGISLTPISKGRLKEFYVYNWESSYYDYILVEAANAEEAGKKAIAQGFTKYQPKVRIKT